MIVGIAIIEEVTKGDSLYESHLTGVQRSKNLRKPKGHPQSVWFDHF